MDFHFTINHSRKWYILIDKIKNSHRQKKNTVYELCIPHLKGRDWELCGRATPDPRCPSVFAPAAS